MILYRCTLKKWAKDLSGQGALLYGGRWNSRGKYVVYTAENNLLAALEVALRVPLTNISSDYVLVPIFVPDSSTVYSPHLPKGWNRNHKVTQQIGNQFLEENKFLLMKMPSALMSNSFNFLINPNHKMYKANVQVVVAFRMLPEAVWAMPTIGTFNLHASLLPQYRGAAPINWAIINGEKETGVTTFFLKHEIDTGSIIFQEKEIIHDDDDVVKLYERLMHKGASLVLKTVKAIEAGSFPSLPQIETVEIKHAPKIYKETCEIKWNQSSEQIRNFVRGLNPYPTAWSTLNGKVFKVFRVQSTADSQLTTAKSGEIVTDNKTSLQVKTQDGWLSILEFQPEGKK